MRGQIQFHIGRHRWFYLALVSGLAAWIATRALSFNVRLAIAGDTFYFVYLVLIAALVTRTPIASFRDWLDDEDEGVFIVMLITIGAVAISLFSIFSLLNAGRKAGDLDLVLSLASAPLGWLVMHTVYAFRYAHAYYLARAGGVDTPETGGLGFPGTHDPGVWEFLYYSFVIGMTAQVSDVQVLTVGMRRLTLLHGVLSFMFNTVLIALAVNTVVALAQAS